MIFIHSPFLIYRHFQLEGIWISDDRCWMISCRWSLWWELMENFKWKIYGTIRLVVWLPFFIFPYIGSLIIPIDVHIFQRGGPTTNQQSSGNSFVRLVRFYDRKLLGLWYIIKYRARLINQPTQLDTAPHISMSPAGNSNAETIAPTNSSDEWMINMSNAQ